MIKKIAIVPTVFPGCLFAVALVSYMVCFFAELGLPRGGADIGLGLLINLPTLAAWLAWLAPRGFEGRKSG